MSAPEETKMESAAGMEAGAAVAQLRALVCGLGAAVLVLSLVFDAFVLKQNRNLQAESNNRGRQANQIAGTLERWVPALNDLARYSVDKPELVGIFRKYGVEITTPPSETAPTRPVQP
jgi:hypothetical protein